MNEQRPSVDETLARAILAVISNVVPFAGAVIEPVLVVYDDVRARRAQRTALALLEVAESVGGPERLGERLRKDPLQESQMVQGLEEAVRTGHEAKRRLLVRAVINSLQHQELFDESQITIDVLSQFDVMHIRALARLDEELAEDGSWALPLGRNDDGTITDADKGRGNGRSPAWADLPDPIRAALVRAGVSRDMPPMTILPSYSDRPTEGINTFGRQLLAQLRSEAEGSDS